MKTTAIHSCCLFLLSAALVACGSSSAGTGTYVPATYLDGSADAADVSDSDDVENPEDTASPAPDIAEDAGTTSPPEDTFVDPGFDDVEEEEETVAAPPGGMLYAHTKDTLYTLDIEKFAMVEVGKFTFDKKKGLVTDIALDQFRNMWAVTFTELFECEADTAKCKWVAKLPKEFNGLTFIPESLVPGSSQEALIGISEAGDWNWIKPDNKGGVTMKKLGSYGNGWLSSGDAFSVVGIGTFATLKKKSGGIDSLAKVDPKTGKILKVIGSTGAKGLFGFAWWANVFYGFSTEGKVWEIDVQTGKATQTTAITVPKDVKWWGAGVSTRANGP